MPISHRIPLAWFNLTHDPARLLTSIGGVTFSVLLMLMFTGFKNALYDSQTYLLNQLNADLVIVDTLRNRIAAAETFERTRLYQAQNVEGVSAAYPLYIQLADWRNPETNQIRTVRVLAFNPSHDLLQLPDVQAQAAELRLPDTVLLDQKSRPEVGLLAVGRSTEIQEQNVQIAGIVTLGTDFSSADGNVITSDRTFFELFRQTRPEQWDAVDVGLVKTAPGADISEIRAKLQAYLPDDVAILSREGFIQRERDYWQKNTSIGFVFTLMTGMGFVVGIVLVYQILYTDVADHWAEYATLKAMGYTNTYLLSVVLQEALLLSVLGFIPGLCIGGLFYATTANATGLLFQLTPGRVGTQFLLTLLMCLVSGIIAVRKVQSTDPAEVF